MARPPIGVRSAMAQVGQNLRHWRRLLRLSRRELARRADISESTLTRLESGQGASLDNLLKVARALGILAEVTDSTSPWGSERGQLLAGAELDRRSAP